MSKHLYPSKTTATSGSSPRSRPFKAKAPEVLRLAAVEALASGLKHEAAAKAAGVPVRTMRRWLAEDPEFGELLAQAQQELLKEVRRRLRGSAVAAVERVIGLIDTGTKADYVKLEAAQDVLDRMLGKAPTRIAGADEELPPLMVQFVHPRAKREQEEEKKA